MELDENARLQALYRYRILDSDPEKAFDDLTILASHICQTPVALITIIDSGRQWFKSKVGVNVSETHEPFRSAVLPSSSPICL
jgi:hypothetical protein